MFYYQKLQIYLYNSKNIYDNQSEIILINFHPFTMSARQTQII
jgi:hypothetical protein